MYTLADGQHLIVQLQQQIKPEVSSEPQVNVYL